MRKLSVIIIIAVAGHLGIAALALGQGGNPPATTDKTGATSGKGMTAVQQAADGSPDPSRFTYLRLYCTPDGNSHFQRVTGELRTANFAPPAAPLYVGESMPASSAFFGGFDPHWGAHDKEARLYHPAPAVQFIIVLGGTFSITATDGETKRFDAGDVLRLEDTAPCKGHITVVGDKPGYFMFVR